MYGLGQQLPNLFHTIFLLSNLRRVLMKYNWIYNISWAMIEQPLSNKLLLGNFCHDISSTKIVFAAKIIFVKTYNHKSTLRAHRMCFLCWCKIVSSLLYSRCRINNMFSISVSQSGKPHKFSESWKAADFAFTGLPPPEV